MCSVPCLGLWQRIYSHTRLSIWILRSLSPKIGKGTKHKEPLPEHIAWVGCSFMEFSKVSWCRAGHCQSAWDLRLQEALGSCSQGSHVPDARLYSLARLQQFSKNASNYKYFSLNRSMFADLGISGTFPTVPLPSAPFASNLWMMLHLWHTGTHEIKRTCWNEVTIQSFRGIKNGSKWFNQTWIHLWCSTDPGWQVLLGSDNRQKWREGKEKR